MKHLGRPTAYWSDEEWTVLRRLFREGKTDRDIAREMHRSEQSVQNKRLAAGMFRVCHANEPVRAGRYQKPTPPKPVPAPPVSPFINVSKARLMAGR